MTIDIDADIDHHSAMLFGLTPQITNRVCQHKGCDCLTQTVGDCSRDVFFFVLDGNVVLAVAVVFDHIVVFSVCGENTGSTNIVGGSFQRINEISGEQIVVKHFLRGIWINEDIGIRGGGKANIAGLGEQLQYFTDIFVDCCGIVIVLGVDGSVICFVVNSLISFVR